MNVGGDPSLLPRPFACILLFCSRTTCVTSMPASLAPLALSNQLASPGPDAKSARLFGWIKIIGLCVDDGFNLVPDVLCVVRRPPPPPPRLQKINPIPNAPLGLLGRALPDREDGQVRLVPVGLLERRHLRIGERVVSRSFTSI